MIDIKSQGVSYWTAGEPPAGVKLPPKSKADYVFYFDPAKNTIEL
jgi:hypothetical protein